MSPKTGRPLSNNPKYIRYSIRLDVTTEMELRKYCKEHGIKRGEAVRKAIGLLIGGNK